ncbi:phage portal protein [Glaesserella parasuis]|uniref:phage portal protein n=1 Tax=Glaesserella parasuis TaxID=738 RepID=UPI0013662706|nr:phage portal protein [Glaesserella parasuis]MDP0122633.1 phage portal protein [Glaesserella parasuis]MDP0286336.1 phage portal protein [Glaesserella parasuis]MDP0290529.1 phage portal protein [Glaesserella parasuis]MDP0292612.1 phage portal protein [Glaesserella parasuis]MDP0296836.1 phage portal protein [Glaesserella parasuis]
MNLFEKTIAKISPKWAAERAKHRLVLNAYEAAKPSRLHKAIRENQGANTAVRQSAVSLREQARALDQNHDIVIGILDKLEERVIGSKGIYVEPQPLDFAGNVNESLANDIRRKWAEWSIRPEVTGRFTRPQLERMLLRTWLRDGEVFVHLVLGKVSGLTHATSIPFSLEALEPDFVPMNSNEQDQNLVQGIYLNAWRKPTGYQVYFDNPQEDNRAYGRVKTVPAENMLHLALVKRIHQLRGVSLFHGVIVRLADLKDYEESERVAARIAAALTMYIKKGDPALFDPDDVSKENRYFDIAPGQVVDDLKPGEDIGLINSNRPNTNLESFRNGQLRATAAGTRSSYSSIARDYNGTYSSQRQELVESFEGYAVLQDHFVASISRPIYREWLRMAIASGEIEISPDIDPNSVYNAVYSGPVMPWIDPVKETEAWRRRIVGGLSTESEAIRASGNNPAEVKRRRIVEVEENRKYGLKFDTDLTNTQVHTENVVTEKTEEPDDK